MTVQQRTISGRACLDSTSHLCLAAGQGVLDIHHGEAGRFRDGQLPIVGGDEGGARRAVGCGDVEQIQAADQESSGVFA